MSPLWPGSAGRADGAPVAAPAQTGGLAPDGYIEPMQTTILDALVPESRDVAIAEAARLLLAGGIVAFPTETVYGLGADAFDPAAIERVFLAKGRPSDNPLIVHLADPSQIAQCAIAGERARLLAAAFMPGPLTLVLPALDTVPSIARAGLPTVALRVPAHPIAAALLARSGPLVAPSANLSGRPSPTTAMHVYDDLAGRIPAVLNGGPCQVGIESAVVDLSREDAVLLRPGVITVEQIEAVLGEKVLVSGGDHSVPRAPGMKYRHYAPAAMVRLLMATEIPSLPPNSRRVILTLPRYMAAFPGEDVRPLQESTVYALFREADAARIEEIVIYVQPGELEAGLLDRIRKASAN